MTATPINFQINLTESHTVLNQGADASVDSIKAGARAIVARGVEMVFQSGTQRFQALKNIDLDVYRGDIQLLMGPSGSGKTTLLSILGGILTPTAGSVCLLGQDLTRMSRSQLARFRLKNIGFIFQEFNLFPALTALENIVVAIEMKGVKGRAARQEAMRLLEQVELEGKANNLPRDLSGGQKQRVAIARALAGDPHFIMADEPTAALDSRSGQAVVALLRRLAKEQGRTVVMVTHDSRIVEEADRVAYIEDGMLQSTRLGGATVGA
ncbi:MAG: ABC transporter ATP-binding protein [Leptolyngbya sp. IPPAS B-1204]|uniref:ABC transporter ATP-binding protein n=1 Tax=Leptolyngbya sp. NK1-12 TaxID=2547451 RepID=A0AA97AKC9_9CYAN|nr:ABC transporter ATP-binding protein [Leptolyngbya sp. NK1-12]MBF2046482.1 ABC transporter ATP-binding protein [Elainella sp. C42_A2020_010]RNJ69777.1 MAG: ABC transporter ATP-binding protein [Leptolyngbya sp. IPPAS B-1204]WNZ25951.1 ABC transporter ATP-binding protein [Leptolyngbya sp. NK1-12]